MVYQFPKIDEKAVITRLSVDLGNKIVEAKIEAKKKAQEKYDDAIASQNTAIIM